MSVAEGVIHMYPHPVNIYEGRFYVFLSSSAPHDACLAVIRGDMCHKQRVGYAMGAVSTNLPHGHELPPR